MEKSIIEIKIGEKVRGFKFGTFSMGITCQKENCTLGALVDKLTRDDVQPMTVLNVIYGSAVSYCKSKKQAIDFDVDDVADWIDELGFETAMELLRKGLEVYEPKNSEAPATGR